MVTTRIDSNGLLQIYQPENAAWTQAMTLVQLVNGFDVKLTGAQGVAMQQVAVEIQRLSDLLSELKKANTYSSSIANSSEQMLSALGGTTNANLGAIANRTALLEAHQSLIEQKLDSLIAIGESEKTKIDQVTAAVTGSAITTVSNYLVKITSVDIEYPLALVSKTKSIRFRSRKISSSFIDIRYSFSPGQVNSISSGQYSTLNGGNEYYQTGMNLNSSTLYLSSSNAGTIEVEVYS